jgi:hypothetical protein
MKSLQEIKDSNRVTINQISEDGGNGIISMPGWKGSVIFSYGGGWDHVSVSPEKKRITPSWEDMCRIKSIFWNDDEDVIQIHPKKAEYVNNMSNCLHLWRCTYKEMVLPPSCFVGLKKGQTMAELNREIREAYALAGEEF